MKKLNRVWNKTGMRQIINTPHKTFNKQTNCLDNSGNCLSNTQICFYIRAYNDTINPIGKVVDPGYLQNFDLAQFNNLPGSIKELCRSDEEACWWVSEIRIFHGDHKQVICYFVRNLKTDKIYTFKNCINAKQHNLVEYLFNYLFVEEV